MSYKEIIIDVSLAIALFGVANWAIMFYKIYLENWHKAKHYK